MNHPAALLDRARSLDAADPLAGYRDRFLGADDPEVPSYLDGNSLGRPLKATLERLSSFITEQWGGRLIRGWDEGWLTLPGRIGDELGRVMLGAAPGQATIGDSTTVLLYKLCRAAVAARPDRSEIVIDRDNFPTDRFVLEGIAAECGLTLRWVQTPFDGGVTAESLAPVLGPATALVVLSNVAYRSGYLADVAGITARVHEAGALMLWDLCHSAGVVPMQLDAWNVDLAVGCTYKYLNGGPGSPAFAYVRADLQEVLRQPIQGWLGSADPFGMGESYQAAPGIRGFTSGTPPILGMQAMRDMIELIDEAGMGAVRAKSEALTGYAVELYDAILAPLGVQLSSPRTAERRGSHITVDHPAFRGLTARLWERGIIPDFRNPHGIRIGLSPLSTSFEEVLAGVAAIAAELG
ncbi:aminotransferase class V-fold PLP-dependent enzyme [Paenarthrobacter sp. DKR-5]|uniref:kynureninase n=1 Tax=Paenarthrobacter sp. DKR-5 TaxID=2835535 RepID=UPI001BDD0976|nr:aminotransferase class V-fold PLP-dependent enzyme [Paenarthrobacter sp. DKR-5]MBT1001811.1 aminotransferase class V-fold PLP-dependent enzyme [Paenarthrobacter sp. DKR-5]